MNCIPVCFIYNDKIYKGTLDEVHGAGSNVFHLMVGGYYCGRLRWSEFLKGWAFDENKFGAGELVDFFGEFVTKSKEWAK
jgi:hypothetical protein